MVVLLMAMLSKFFFVRLVNVDLVVVVVSDLLLHV